MSKQESQFRSEDRDLLIRIDEKLDRNIKDIQNIFERLGVLDTKKVDVTEALEWRKDVEVQHADHENRLRRLEYVGALVAGGLFVIQVLLKFLFK